MIQPLLGENSDFVDHLLATAGPQAPFPNRNLAPVVAREGLVEELSCWRNVVGLDKAENRSAVGDNGHDGRAEDEPSRAEVVLLKVVDTGKLEVDLGGETRRLARLGRLALLVEQQTSILLDVEERFGDRVAVLSVTVLASECVHGASRKLHVHENDPNVLRFTLLKDRLVSGVGEPNNPRNLGIKSCPVCGSRLGCERSPQRFAHLGDAARSAGTGWLLSPAESVIALAKLSIRVGGRGGNSLGSRTGHKQCCCACEERGEPHNV